jgi:hypothetical protein
MIPSLPMIGEEIIDAPVWNFHLKVPVGEKEYKL